MTFEIFLVLALLALAIGLFALEWLSVDVSALILVSILVLTGILGPEEAFSGFASEIIVILVSIFVLSGAMIQTGLMDWVGFKIGEVSGGSPAGILALVMIVAASISAFMNNTTTTGLLMPAIFTLCRRNKISPSKILIPLAFASMLGGTCTLIGTSTNVAASGFMRRTGLEPFTLFEFAPIGITIVVAGILYMTLVGHRLLPQIKVATYSEDYEIKKYLTEIVIPPGSALGGQSLQKTQLAKMDLIVLEIIRGEQQLYPEPYALLREEDILIVQGTKESLLQVKEIPGIEIKADVQLGDQDLITDTIKIVEAIVMPQSNLIGRTLKELNFRRRFGVTCLAIYRKGHALASKLASLRLRVGDVLLLQGRREQFESIWGNPDLLVLEELDHVPFRKKKGFYTVLVLLLALLLGGLNLLPLSIAFLLAALAAVLLKCITMEEAYTYIDWRLVILIGGMTAFGVAMDKTGAAQYLANAIVYWTLPLGMYFIIAGFLVLTVVLTQPMSNAAAALVVLPVALSTAAELQVNPRTFAVLITLAASLSFITPLEPSCIIVYGPGKYRFRDFMISGFPLTLIVFVLLMLLVPVFWPL